MCKPSGTRFKGIKNTPRVKQTFKIFIRLILDMVEQKATGRQANPMVPTAFSLLQIILEQQIHLLLKNQFQNMQTHHGYSLHCWQNSKLQRQLVYNSLTMWVFLCCFFKLKIKLVIFAIYIPFLLCSHTFLSSPSSVLITTDKGTHEGCSCKNREVFKHTILTLFHTNSSKQP